MSSLYGLSGGFWLGGLAALLAAGLSWIWMAETVTSRAGNGNKLNL
nr:hypothetical protein [Paenibacillus donghaensis]